MYSNTRNVMVIYPAFYDVNKITTPNKVGCITETIDKGYDGYGSRPYIIYIQGNKDSNG